MIQIGPYRLKSRVVLAPMAGVTDRPFRQLCRQHGAAMTASEMLTSDVRLWHSEKSRLRRRHDGEAAPRIIQIAGSDPAMMAEAARLNVAEGAQIIDINMGCPAKKVLKRAAGSALLKDEALVRDILKAVVSAVPVPVTLKIRTGWSRENRNGPVIARLAEDCGIQALAVHGRTRECAFKGEAEYDTIARICESVDIPVFANGDIDSPQKAAAVLHHTGADGIMIGRGAQGRPWIFRHMEHYLAKGEELSEPQAEVQAALICGHLQALYNFYGEEKGVQIARKHVSWYLQNRPDSQDLRRSFNALPTTRTQLGCIQRIFTGRAQISSEKEEEIAA